MTSALIERPDPILPARGIEVTEETAREVSATSAEIEESILINKRDCETGRSPSSTSTFYTLPRGRDRLTEAEHNLSPRVPCLPINSS